MSTDTITVIRPTKLPVSLEPGCYVLAVDPRALQLEALIAAKTTPPLDKCSRG